MLYGQIFEVGDVVALDTSRDVGASNNRRLAALYCSSNSGFEVNAHDYFVQVLFRVSWCMPWLIVVNYPGNYGFG